MVPIGGRAIWQVARSESKLLHQNTRPRREPERRVKLPAGSGWIASGVDERQQAMQQQAQARI